MFSFLYTRIFLSIRDTLNIMQISKAKQANILEMVGEGKSTYRIAEDLKISWATADKYVRMYRPLLIETEHELEKRFNK